MVKAKATKFCPRGRGQSSRTPIPGLFYRATLRRERLCQVVCLSIILKFNALLPPLVHLCMKYCIYGIESFTYHTQKFNVLRPDLEAKVKAGQWHCRGQGQGSSRPRPCVFEAKATKFCPRGRGQSSRTLSLAVISNTAVHDLHNVIAHATFCGMYIGIGKVWYVVTMHASAVASRC